MTYDIAAQLHAGLTSLDSKEGFECDDPKTLYAIARNIGKLEPILKVVQKTRRSLQKTHFGDLTQIPNNHPNIGPFNEDLLKFLESELPEDIGLRSFSSKTLKVTNNKVSGPTLAKLAPILSDWADLDKETEEKK